MNNCISKLSRLLTLPKTHILYSYLGLSEPEEWKLIVFGCLPLGVFLLPTMFFEGYENIPSIAGYDNIFNSLIGLIFLIGSILVLSAWYRKKDSYTQSHRILMEIQGSIFLFGGFFTIFLCQVVLSPDTIYGTIVNLSISISFIYRAMILIHNHYRLVKKEQEDGRD